MELNQVYFKTSKGLEEIQNRTYKLAASLRRLLIMVDGRSTAAEMIQRLTTLGDVAIALGELEAGGFIASGAQRRGQRRQSGQHATAEPGHDPPARSTGGRSRDSDPGPGASR